MIGLRLRQVTRLNAKTPTRFFSCCNIAVSLRIAFRTAVGGIFSGDLLDNGFSLEFGFVFPLDDFIHRSVTARTNSSVILTGCSTWWLHCILVLIFNVAYSSTKQLKAVKINRPNDRWASCLIWSFNWWGSTAGGTLAWDVLTALHLC